jgi:serine/threonine protein kinase
MTNDGKAYIFIDLMGFNVFPSNHLKSNEVSETKVKIWCKSIVDVLSYLHNIGIAFGHNLNINNMLIDKKENLKLFGRELFDCCYKNSGGKDLCDYNDSKNQYFGPEVIHSKHDEICSDVYRLGLIIYYLMTKSFPFDKNGDKNSLVQQISSKSWDNGKIKNELCKDLLSKIFVDDFVMRATIDKVLRHKGFKI